MLHQTTFTYNTLYTKRLLHQKLLSQTRFTPNTFYIMQTPSTPNNIYIFTIFLTRNVLHRTPFYTKQLLHQTPFRPSTTSHTYPLAHHSQENPKVESHFFLEKMGTLLFTGLVLLGPSAGKLYPPTSLFLRSLPCYFCISSPTVPHRTLLPRSPSVASSRAISASPAPPSSDLAPPPSSHAISASPAPPSLTVPSDLAPPP